MDESTRDKVLAHITLERRRQERKWSIQHHNAGVWALILFEEVGEFAQAALERRMEDAMGEVVQIAAVCVGILEDHMDRGVEPCIE